MGKQGKEDAAQVRLEPPPSSLGTLGVAQFNGPPIPTPLLSSSLLSRSRL